MRGSCRVLSGCAGHAQSPTMLERWRRETHILLRHPRNAWRYEETIPVPITDLDIIPLHVSVPLLSRRAPFNMIRDVVCEINGRGEPLGDVWLPTTDTTKQMLVSLKRRTIK